MKKILTLSVSLSLAIVFSNASTLDAAKCDLHCFFGTNPSGQDYIQKYICGTENESKFAFDHVWEGFRNDETIGAILASSFISKFDLQRCITVKRKIEMLLNPENEEWVKSHKDELVSVLLPLIRDLGLLHKRPIHLRAIFPENNILLFVQMIDAMFAQETNGLTGKQQQQKASIIAEQVLDEFDMFKLYFLLEKDEEIKELILTKWAAYDCATKIMFLLKYPELKQDADFELKKVDCTICNPPANAVGIGYCNFHR